MQTDSGMIVVGIFLVIVAIFAAVEQRRAAKARAAKEAAYNDALAETRAQNRELVELQRETNRLIALIAEKLDRTLK
jgi:hypothetical protein